MLQPGRYDWRHGEETVSRTGAGAGATPESVNRENPQVDFLVLSIMSAVVPMIEAKCGTVNERDQNTLKRHVEKAVREFVRGK